MRILKDDKSIDDAVEAIKEVLLDRLIGERADGKEGVDGSNGVDGSDGVDADGDGHASRWTGGDDCDDADQDVWECPPDE